MKPIGVGVIGTGFMGKAHSIAYSASASVFGTGLRPKLETVSYTHLTLPTSDLV